MTETMYVLRVYLLGDRIPHSTSKGTRIELEAIMDRSARNGGIWFGDEFVPMHRIHSATVKLDDGT